MITFVPDLTDRIDRYCDSAYSAEPTDAIEDTFLAHLTGLDSFRGKRVLEIGGRDDNNLQGLFLRIGASYTMVTLDVSTNPRVFSRTDFTDLPCDKPYDLVISAGVFEGPGIAEPFSRGERFPRKSNQEYLEKLAKLTTDGGYLVIGTMTDPCLFSDEYLETVGFRVEFRERPFYWLGRDGYKSGRTSIRGDTTDELIVARRMP